ncbi:MAG: response regulator transcription factor [Bdellovibrionaceae bacterium]|nr:response regulator transcription factor [Pseudobdellovibrionaceae bacterium]
MFKKYSIDLTKDLKLPRAHGLGKLDLMDLKKRVLFLDDDEAFLENIKFAFAPLYRVSLAKSIAEAEQSLSTHPVDVIVLDCHLGSEDGHVFMDQLQNRGPRPPVIVVSGRLDVKMATGFLKRQIHDFFEKPIAISELQNSIDRISGTQGVRSLGFEIDTTTRKVFVSGQHVLLTPTEFEILAYFLKHRRVQVARAAITAHLWGKKSVSRNAFDTHLLNLKKKLPPFAERLTSVYGAGYCYEA